MKGMELKSYRKKNYKSCQRKKDVQIPEEEKSYMSITAIKIREMVDDFTLLNTFLKRLLIPITPLHKICILYFKR